MKYALLQLLSDGEWHSGSRLARQLGLSRTAIWKQIRSLNQLPGIIIQSEPKRGYRLQRPLQLLQQEYLAQALSEKDQLWLLPQVDSSNDFLARQPEPQAQSVQFCLAEYQTAGKGRRGRSWQSPFGQNIYLSMRRYLPLSLAELSGISIAIAARLADYLYREWQVPVQLKWPNDVLIDGQKLAGILLEAQGEMNRSQSLFIIGLGLNLFLSAEQMAQIDQPCTCLQAHCSHIDRNRMAADLIRLFKRCSDDYAQFGLEADLALWRQYDAYQGKQVVLSSESYRITGIYQGLDHNGCLLLKDEQGRIKKYYAGELSLRLG